MSIRTVDDLAKLRPAQAGLAIARINSIVTHPGARAHPKLAIEAVRGAHNLDWFERRLEIAGFRQSGRAST